MEMETVTPETPKGVICIMDESGDNRIQWDPNDPEQVGKAREEFDRLKQKGWVAYKVDRQGSKREVIQAFDPAAERIVFRPQMMGG